MSILKIMPRPWHVNTNGGLASVIHDAKDEVVLPNIRKDFAEYVVKAVNHYENHLEFQERLDATAQARMAFADNSEPDEGVPSAHESSMGALLDKICPVLDGASPFTKARFIRCLEAIYNLK